MIAIAALLVAGFLAVSASGVVPGKSTFLRQATVSGEGISQPLTFDVGMLRANVYALHAPGNGIELPRNELAALEAVEFPYEVSLVSEAGRWGTPSRTYRYDGGSLLLTGGPAWYEASPQLADALRLETAWAQLAPGEPPLAIETFSTRFRRIAIALSLTVAAIAGLYMRGQKPATAPPWRIAERLEQRRLPLDAGAVR